ncbi:MAG: hypothetical protein WBF17_18350, partial [Phycisphaerae bacterium]
MLWPVVCISPLVPTISVPANRHRSFHAGPALHLPDRPRPLYLCPSARQEVRRGRRRYFSRHVLSAAWVSSTRTARR